MHSADYAVARCLSACLSVRMLHIHTYIQMLRLKWHCHRTVAGALYKIIVSNSCSAVFRRRTHETVSSSVPGGTAATMEWPWQTTAGYSRHVPLPPVMCRLSAYTDSLFSATLSSMQRVGFLHFWLNDLEFSSESETAADLFSQCYHIILPTQVRHKITNAETNAIKKTQTTYCDINTSITLLSHIYSNAYVCKR